MNPLNPIMIWLAGLPLPVRLAAYNVAIALAALGLVLVWALPLLDVDHLWRLDLEEIGKISIATGGLAALLAKANASDA